MSFGVSTTLVFVVNLHVSQDVAVNILLSLMFQYFCLVENALMTLSIPDYYNLQSNNNLVMFS